MKVSVTFTPQEKETITAFADLVTDTCAAVHTECSVCPFESFCNGTLGTSIYDSAGGYDSEAEEYAPEAREIPEPVEPLPELLGDR